jgi:hypothetical protein
MEDKRKLTAAIMGAIAVYIQMEQKPPQVAPGSSPEQKLNGEKFPNDRSKRGK